MVTTGPTPKTVLGLGVIVVVMTASLVALASKDHRAEEAPAVPAAAALPGGFGAPCLVGWTDRATYPAAVDRRPPAAAWARRCRGRTAEQWAGPSILRERAGSIPLASVDLTAGLGPGAADTGGVVMVTATAWARTHDRTGCACRVGVRLTDTARGAAPSAGGGRLPAAGDVRMSASQIIPINAGETKTFEATGYRTDPDDARVEYVVRLTALFVPLAPQGDDTLAALS